MGTRGKGGKGDVVPTKRVIFCKDSRSHFCQQPENARACADKSQCMCTLCAHGRCDTALQSTRRHSCGQMLPVLGGASHLLQTNRELKPSSLALKDLDFAAQISRQHHC